MRKRSRWKKRWTNQSLSTETLLTYQFLIQHIHAPLLLYGFSDKYQLHPSSLSEAKLLVRHHAHNDWQPQREWWCDRCWKKRRKLWVYGLLSWIFCGCEEVSCRCGNVSTTAQKKNTTAVINAPTTFYQTVVLYFKKQDLQTIKKIRTLELQEIIC